MDLILHVSDDGDNLKLVWSGHGPGEHWVPNSYLVNAALLQQAANAVREQLQDFALLRSTQDETAFRPLLQNLMKRGHDLYLQLLPDSDDNEFDEIRERLEEILTSVTDERPDLIVTLQTQKLFVPWGFVFVECAASSPTTTNFSLAALQGFLLTRFCISIICGGSRSLPRPRKPTFRKLYALDEHLFGCARVELAKQWDNLDQRLAVLLEGDPPPATDWDMFQQAWNSVAHHHDSVLFLYGHSDGQHFWLKTQSNEPKYLFLAASLKNLRKKVPGSASVFLLNGCHTAAPAPASPVEPLAASFLKLTRQTGYYGFIGTEAEVPNTFACHYGTEFLWRLCVEGKSVGEAFDELLESDHLFPQNVLYTCYAEREFRFEPVDGQAQQA